MAEGVQLTEHNVLVLWLMLHMCGLVACVKCANHRHEKPCMQVGVLLMKHNMFVLWLVLQMYCWAACVWKATTKHMLSVFDKVCEQCGMMCLMLGWWWPCVVGRAVYVRHDCNTSKNVLEGVCLVWL